MDFDHILNWIISQAPPAFVIWETLIQMESSSKDWLHSSFRRRSTRSNSVGVHLWSSTEALTKLDKKLINPISIWRCKFHQKSIKCWSNCCVTLIINQSKVDRSGGLTLIKFRDEILIKWIKSWSRMQVPLLAVRIPLLLAICLLALAPPRLTSGKRGDSGGWWILPMLFQYN